MAVGGMAVALRLRKKWPKLILNETHPKVLLNVWGQRYDPRDPAKIDAAIQWLVGEAKYIEPNVKGEHELDAALSAWGTQKGLTEGWTNIIGVEDDLLFPAGEVRYLWPKRSAERVN